MVDVFAYIKRFLIGLYETLVLPFGFLSDSFQDTGRSRGLIIGLPAVLVVLVVTVLAVHSTLSDNSGLVNRYSSAIEQLGDAEQPDKESEIALKNNELKRAKNKDEALRIIDEYIPMLEERDFYYRRLVTLKDSTDDDKFNLARSALEIRHVLEIKLQLLGEQATESKEGEAVRRRVADEYYRGMALLAELAPLSEPRFADAHFVKAQQELLELAKKGSPQVRLQKMRIARIHLEYTVQLDDKNIDAIALLGQVCMQLRDFQNAAKYYEQVLTKRPLVYSDLRTCYLLTEQESKIGEMLEDAVKSFLPYIQKDKNNVKAWQGLTDCFILKNEHEEAEKLLLPAYKAAKSEFLRGRLSALVMNLYQRWISVVSKDGKPDYDMQKQLMERALQVNPEHEGLKAMITLLAMSDSEHASWAKGIYDAFADNDLSYDVTTAIVESSIRSGNDEIAKKYLTLQLEKAPEALKKTQRYAFSLNNSAYFLLESDNPEPKRALEMINQALAVPGLSARDKNAIYHTKAAAHMQLGEYETAIADLNKISQFRQNDEGYYEMLIECHQKVQNPQTPTIELLQAELQKLKARNAAKKDDES